MKISTKGEYGIRAMLHLAMHAKGRPVPSREIARQQGIPAAYLRQILAQLGKNRLLWSSRGPQGGHLLAHPAERITLREILLCLEGQTTAIDDILALPCRIAVGPRHCAIREVLLEVKREIEAILGRTTLAALALRQQELAEQGVVVPFTVGRGIMPPAGDP
jgi:Rrf2 family transcriptional regulator, cysteine metabolism repressor